MECRGRNTAHPPGVGGGGGPTGAASPFFGLCVLSSDPKLTKRCLCGDWRERGRAAGQAGAAV